MMTYNFARCWLAAVGGILVWAAAGGSAWAAAMDSSAFEYKYEGDAVTVAAANASGFGNTGYSGYIQNYTLSSDGDILTMDYSSGVGVLDLHNTTWNAEADGAGGWTWEMRFKVLAVPQGSMAFAVRIGDGTVNSADTVDHDIYSIQAALIRNLASADYNQAIDTTDGFHIMRVMQEAGSGLFNVYVDNALAGSYDLAGGGFDAGDNHWIGDGSGSSDGELAIDYIRWTGTGGFAPIPEPSALALLTIAGLSLGLARRRTAANSAAR